MEELVGTGPDGLLLEAVRADLLVVFLGHHPAGGGDVGGPEEGGEVEEGLLEDEADRPIVDDLDALGLLLEDVGLGAPVVLVAEFDVLRSDWLTVVELDPLPQRERGALRIRGDRVAFGQAGMVVELRPLVLHEGVVQSRQEVVRRGGAVMLLGVQPAGRKAGVPGENDLALGGGPGRRRELRGRRSDGEQHQGDGQEPERTTSLESGTPHAGASIHGDELDHREGCRRLARGPTGGQVAATRIVGST